MTRVGYLLQKERAEKSKKEDILKVLIKKFKTVPEVLVQEIWGIRDINILEKLFNIALDTSDLQSFEKEIHSKWI